VLIEIHMIQNYAPNNLNRDDLGAPKTCWFGGVLRQRISSQSLKRSIRMSPEFSGLLGGVRTRRLAELITQQMSGDPKARIRVETILSLCGIAPNKAKGKPDEDDEEPSDAGNSKALVYVSRDAIRAMAAVLEDGVGRSDKELARDFAKLIAHRTAVPDMALSGRMLEPRQSAAGIWDDLDKQVEASLQVMHAFSTHEARPEVDYYVAADDIPGSDAGAGYVDEALFSSACFYKYFSINWEALQQNLRCFGEGFDKLAAHTVGAFLRGASIANPTGKQNAHAAHNRPDGILVEIRDWPISYANAFVRPATEGARPTAEGARELVGQSIAQLGQYVHDMDSGFGEPTHRFWFSPNLRYPLTVQHGNQHFEVAAFNLRSLDDLVRSVIGCLGHDWESVQAVRIGEMPTP